MLNLYDDHFSYVDDKSTYLKKYQCKSYQRHFKQRSHLKRHLARCNQAIEVNFPGGYFQSTDSIFDALEKYGISVPRDDTFYNHFAVFDFEALLLPTSSQTPKLKWLQRHLPISVSICSNISGFDTPRNFIDRDEDALLSSMFDYLAEISDEAYRLSKLKWKDTIQALEDLVKKNEPPEPVEVLPDIRPFTTMEELLEDDGFYEEREESRLADNFQVTQCKHYKAIVKVQKDFEEYIRTLPVIGFNSSKYDLNLVKSKFISHLLEKEKNQPHVIKTNNAYRSIKTERFSFLDISNFLSPGCSLSQFLKAYNTEEQKSFFPYEWFDSKEKLHHPCLPDYESFYSTLKQTNVLDSDYQKWLINPHNREPDPASETYEEERAAYNTWIQNHQRPPTGSENYEKLQRVWRNESMTKFSDFLRYYNDLDVGPLVCAIETFVEFYRQMDVDVFKDAISVPGIARKLLFRTAKESGVTFSLFDKQDQDLFYTVKANIVGGPSIIFKRKHVVGKTFLRGDPERVVQNIEGYDANALYLHCIDQPMPTGIYVRRKRENGFKPELKLRHEAMFHVMDYMSSINENVTYRHARNSDGETKIGPYSVDGFDAENKTIFEFNGCYYHGCECRLTQHVKERSLLKKRARYTEYRQKYLEKEGYSVIATKECEYYDQLENDVHFRDFVNQRLPPFYRKHPAPCRTTDIIDAVKSDLLFGMVECDISVPEDSYERFSEMSPIFCTTDVPFSEFGEHMQEYVTNNKMSEKPRRLLVGGMKAKKIMLATPLLMWYLDHGLEVTHIYQVVEYSPSRCFRSFVKKVSEARRSGDDDPDKSIVADTMKLIGNSGYGSLIMDKFKHRRTLFVDNAGAAKLKFNEPLFCKATALGDNYFEIEMQKSSLRLDLPITLGYFILQLAKLRMLSFYYDCLSMYVDKKDFEMIETDTDSLYFAIAGPNLRSVVKERLKKQYDAYLSRTCVLDKDYESNSGFWFPRTCCDEHRKFDKRTPGLFKLEASGTEMVALSSKTYILKTHEGSTKISSKGVNKSSFENPLEQFHSVLTTKESVSGVNRGMRAKDNTVFTYEQTRSALSYFYCKRRVASDGVSTEPLDITLSPIREYNVHLVDDKDVLGFESEQLIRFDRFVLRSLKTAIIYQYLKHHKTSEELKEISNIVESAKTIVPSPDWYEKRDEVVLTVMKIILPKVKDVLLSTGDKIISVCGAKERYWTTGLNIRTTQLFDPKLYPGQNKLGQLWMKLRDEINAS